MTAESLTGEPAASPAAAIAELGAVIIRRALSPGWVARVVPRGTPALVEGALADPEWLANPQIAPVLGEVLGEAYILGRLVAVPREPNRERALATAALAQFPSRSALFGTPADTRVPAIGVAVYAALGEGRIHARGATVEVAAGDAALFDTRTELRSERGAAMIAAHYRQWFREPVAAVGAPPFAISLVTYLRLPTQLRHLFVWRFDRYARLRPRLVVDRGLRRLPTPVGDQLRTLLRL